MRVLRPTISREAAWQRLHRGPLSRRLWQAVLTICGKRPVAAGLELVYLTHYLVTFPVTQDDRSGVILSLISGYDASFSRIEVAAAAFEPHSAEQTLLPCTVQNTEQILAAARQGTLMALINAPGWATNRARLGEPTVETIGYPVWAYYFRRRKGILDVRTLDGWTGRLGTARVKLALLSALTTNHQQLA